MVALPLKKSRTIPLLEKVPNWQILWIKSTGLGLSKTTHIIIDGENGFLCESGNYEELSRILIKMNRLTEPERRRISDNAVKTAAYYTDFLAAKRYIYNVINL